MNRPIKLRRLRSPADVRQPLRTGETEAKIGNAIWRGTPSQIADKTEKSRNARR